MNHLVIMLLTSTALIRLIPYLITGVPYHTDTYAILSFTELLKSKTPTELIPNSGLGNYEIYWPGVAIYGIIHSVITGLGIKELTSITVPIINSLSTLILIPMLRSLGMSKTYSVIAALVFGLVGTEAVLGAGVTKEGYAAALMMTTLTLTSLAIIRGFSNAYYLVVLTHSSLIITHHLTSVVTLLMMAYLITAYLSSKVLIKRLLTSLAVLAINALTLLTYIYLHSIKALPTLTALTASDIISLITYEYIATLPIWFSLISRSELKYLIRLWFAAIYVLVVALSIAAARVEIAYAAPRISAYELLLFTPYLVIALLGIISVGRISERCLSTYTYLVVLGFVGIELYLIFGTPGLISEAYRLSTFLYLGISILVAYTLSIIKSKYLRSMISLMISAALMMSAYVAPYTAFSSGYVGGSQRIYLPSDILLRDFIKYYIGNITVCGDLRLHYLLYLYVDVDTYSGLLYLLNYSRLKCYLVINELFKEVGYIALQYGIPVNVDDYVLRDNSLIYVGGRNSLVGP